MPVAAVGAVSLDGAAIPADSFTAIPGSGYAAAALRVEPGTHRLASDAPFGVVVYGFDQDDSYGYAGGNGAGAVASVTSVSLSPARRTAAVGSQACVTVTVTDSAGTALPGVRVDLSVDGTNPATQSVTTGADGTVPFCWTGTAAGEDVVTARSSGARATASVTWTQNATNQPPTARPGSVALDEDTSAAVVLDGSDPEGAVLAVTVVSGPEHGTLTGTAPRLTYRPAPDYSGPDGVEFVGDDGTQSSPAQDLTFRATGLPDGLTASSFTRDPATGRWSARISGRAAAGAGRYPVTVTVDDGSGGADSAAVTIDVAPERVTVVNDRSVPVPTDPSSGVVPRLTVPFTVTEEKDQQPSADVDAAGTAGVAPVRVVATTPAGTTTLSCLASSLVAGTGGTATGSCDLVDVPAGTYDLAFVVDNDRFAGRGAGVLTVQASVTSTGRICAGGEIRPDRKHAMEFGLTAGTSRGGSRAESCSRARVRCAGGSARGP